MSKTSTIIGVVLTILLLGGIGYVYYTNSGDLLSTSSILPTDSLVTETATTTDPGQDQTLQRLNRLENINIDTEFLSSQTFRSFENFGIEIQSQPVGRSNPFTPPEVEVPVIIKDNETQLPETGAASQSSEQDDQNAQDSTTSVDQLPSVPGSITTSSEESSGSDE